MNLDNELKEYLSWAYEIGKKDGNGLAEVRKELNELIEAYVTTRVKEAERLARIDELKNLPWKNAPQYGINNPYVTKKWYLERIEALTHR